MAKNYVDVYCCGGKYRVVFDNQNWFYVENVFSEKKRDLPKDEVIVHVAKELQDAKAALREVVKAFWGDWLDLPKKYRDSVRREFPNHPAVKAEKLIGEVEPEE